MKRSWRVSRKQANARTRMYGLRHIDDRSVAPWMACHLTKWRRGRDYSTLSSLRYPAPLESRTRHPVSPVQREKGPPDLFLFRFAPAPRPFGAAVATLRRSKSLPAILVEPYGFTSLHMLNHFPHTGDEPPCEENGGEGGIRTPGPLRVNGFQDRRLKPLGHLSKLFKNN